LHFSPWLYLAVLLIFKTPPMGSDLFGHDAAVYGAVNGLSPKSSEKISYFQLVSSAIDIRVGMTGPASSRVNG
jgi:hypothetical protein